MYEHTHMHMEANKHTHTYTHTRTYIHMYKLTISVLENIWSAPYSEPTVYKHVSKKPDI